LKKNVHFIFRPKAKFWYKSVKFFTYKEYSMTYHISFMGFSKRCKVWTKVLLARSRDIDVISLSVIYPILTLSLIVNYFLWLPFTATLL